MRISDWSSDVCSSDLPLRWAAGQPASRARHLRDSPRPDRRSPGRPAFAERQPGRSHHRTCRRARQRSEEHTSELQSLMRISYAVFCLKKKNNVNLKVHTKQYTTIRQTITITHQT